MRIPTKGGSKINQSIPRRLPLDPSCVLDLPFREGTGTKANDQTIFGNHGTINGATWVHEGPGGSAMSFDGNDDYIDCGDNLNIQKYFSISMWFKTATLDWPTLIAREKGATDFWYIYLGSSGEIYVEMKGGGGALYRAYTSNTINYADDVWHKVIWTRNDDTQEIYIDGVAKSVYSNNPTDCDFEFTTEIVSVGRAVAGYFFNGSIAELQIFNRKVFPEELKQYHLLTKPN